MKRAILVIAVVLLVDLAGCTRTTGDTEDAIDDPKAVGDSFITVAVALIYRGRSLEHDPKCR